MCGIAAIVGVGSAADRMEAVRRMTAKLAHRGPDGHGFFNGTAVSLGHRRLSIIDPKSGKQPISNEDETVWLTYNGEIYNYQELRSDLIRSGHKFRTNCDSEVIVHAYEQWGPECVEKFRGMFAFGLVDLNKQRLMIARDQLGIKPLYYRCENQSVALASELPSLLESLDAAPQISSQAIDYFLRYRYIPAPQTAYRNIHKLPPATYQIYDFAGNKLDECEYWKLKFEANEQLTSDEWLEQFEEVLMDSVRAHLVADVPFGAFLSGGIDSTLVVSCMAKLLNQKVLAYTIDFDEEKYSEHRFAKQAAERLGIELRHAVVRPNVVDAMQRLFTNYGEPFADTSAVPTWWVSELARRDVPMVLSGDGADEAFAGYDRYERWLDDSLLDDAKNFLKYPKRLLRRITTAWQQGIAGQRLNRWQTNFVGVLDRPCREQLWHSERWPHVNSACPAFEKAATEARANDKLSFAQYVDIKTYLPGDILTKVDIASMQHGLEVRTPFTDVRVMEFAATLPISQRCRQVPQGRQLKSLPKRQLAREFPAEFVERKKMGFAIPEANWMQKSSPVRSCFEDLLATPSSPMFDYFQRESIDAMRAEFDQRGRHATALWSLFALAFWFDQQSNFNSTQAAA